MLVCLSASEMSNCSFCSFSDFLTEAISSLYFPIPHFRSRLYHFFIGCLGKKWTRIMLSRRRVSPERKGASHVRVLSRVLCSVLSLCVGTESKNAWTCSCKAGERLSSACLTTSLSSVNGYHW